MPHTGRLTPRPQRYTPPTTPAATEADMWADIKAEQEERKRVQGQGQDGGGQAAQALQKQLDYYPSGLTPPTTHIVRRRFAETRMHGPYPVCVVVVV